MPPERAAATAQVEVAGLRLHLEAAAESDLDLVRRMVGDAPATAPPDATIHVGTEPPPLPDRPPDFEGPYGDHWDDGVVHSFRHHWGLAATVNSEGAVLGGPATGYARWVSVRNSMLFVMARLFFPRGGYVLHGAGLRRGALGVLAVGESGAGKSTLAYAAHRAGWGVMADDMVVVRPGPDGATIRGIPRVPSIPAEVARLTGATGETMPEDPRDRLELVHQDMDLGVADLRAVVVCGHGTTAGAITPIDSVTALYQLVHAFVLADLTGPLRQWFPVASRLSQGTCLRLEHAPDLGDRLAGAGALLDEVADHCDRRGGDAQRP